MGMDIKVLAAYFVLGGAVIASITYFGSRGQGLMAAFINNLPTITIITLTTIYLRSGAAEATSYFKNILIMLPAWLAYVTSIILLLPRVGLILSLIVGIAIYLGSAFVTARLMR